MKFNNVIIICLVSLIALSGCANNQSMSSQSNSDTFAKCLTEKGATMYGTEWCPHCQNQKKEFGKSFQHVDYIDCDKNKVECQKAGIRGYPTWKIDGQNYPGRQSLEKLSALSGCELNVGDSSLEDE